MNIAKQRIDGTHMPTNIPSSLKPTNHRDTESRKLIKDKITG